jgi:hypothetical protein
MGDRSVNVDARSGQAGGGVTHALASAVLSAMDVIDDADGIAAVPREQNGWPSGGGALLRPRLLADLRPSRRNLRSLYRAGQQFGALRHTVTPAGP